MTKDILWLIMLGLIFAPFIGLIILYLIINHEKKEPPQGTIITYDEFSPENMDYDETLRRLKLRNEFNELEK